MPLRIPEDVDRFDIMTPPGSNTRDVFVDRGIRVGRTEPFSIMITKEGRLPFDVLFMAYEATGPTRVIFERIGGLPDVVRNVS